MKPISPPFVTASSGGRCCSTGHPVLADPMTGRTVCSCKLQTGVPAYLSRVPSLPETVYSRPGLTHVNKMSSAVAEHSRSAFYPSLPVERQPIGTSPSSVHPYYLEHMIASHPYGPMYPAFDINGNRRKNASKESTGPLKAWLYQHRKNPYPTKGEKVMLAIISQMTLTQVSTWFANARRRLKKESKMADKDVDLSDLEIEETDAPNESFSSHVTDSDIDSPASLGNISKSASEHSDISDTESHPGSSDRKSSSTCSQRLFSPDGRTEHHFDRSLSPTDGRISEKGSVNEEHDEKLKSSSPQNVVIQSHDSNLLTGLQSTNSTMQKPKIWSIAQMLG